MPWVDEVTSDETYVRFHGRNAAQWFGTSTNERYDYLYAAPELQQLTNQVSQLLRRVKRCFGFLNNHYMGKAVTNAQQMKGMLYTHATH
jgi:uncharacterized protein YecE (DUF72 family)